MFTNKISSYYSPGKVLLDSACLSSDTKPTTGVANGSKLLEMDTSTVYAFDEANGEWLAQSSSGGGGGGGVEPLIVNSTYDSSSELYTLDKTFGEIRIAYNNVQPIIIHLDESFEGSIAMNDDTVSGIRYEINDSSIIGTIRVEGSDYSCSSYDAPFTLEALDALYPGR